MLNKLWMNQNACSWKKYTWRQQTHSNTQAYALEYLFNTQVRVRLPTAKARLLVATEHSLHNRGHLMFCKSQCSFQTSSAQTWLSWSVSS